MERFWRQGTYIYGAFASLHFSSLLDVAFNVGLCIRQGVTWTLGISGVNYEKVVLVPPISL